jgi:putative membrane protein
MVTASQVLTALVALLHVYFLVLEMFLWTKPFGMKTFKRTREQQEETKVLAANQGLYNGFLAAGLIWSAYAKTGAFDTRVFFLVCVVIAGIYGGATAAKSIFFVQALPGAAALGVTIAAHYT